MSNHETDPAIVFQLDQQTAEFNNRKDEFLARFGFEHDCHCDTDYTEGKVTTVTECFVQLAYDALNACQRLQETIDELEAELGDTDGAGA